MKRRILASLLCLLLITGMCPSVVMAGEPGSQPEPAQTIYVSEEGNDVSGDGTQEKPYSSLKKAVEMAPDEAVIYVMSDMTINDLARVTDKHLTITSVDSEKPVILTRGSIQGADNNQSHYNSAMIEVTTNGSSDSDNASSVTLTNIILTDDGEHDGTYFAQTNNKTISESNLDFVQDGMITAHGKSNRAVNIILGYGAVLKDYGGMSAVYGTMNAHITMKAGSCIRDDIVIDRVKSSIPHKDENGPAGAIWLQGADFVMEDGAEIRDMVGRVVYADGGTVTIGGTICNIKSDKDMWQGNGGFVVHLRQGAEGTLTGTASVDNRSLSTSGNALSIFKDCTLTVQNGSQIQNFKDCNVFYVQQDNALLYLDGKVTGCTGSSHIVQANSDAFQITIGENADISGNTVGYGAIYAFSNDNAQGECGKIDVYGKINNNLSTDRGGAIAMANNGSNLMVNMYDGAEICNNVSTQTGGGILVSCGTFTMYGGTISGNISGANVATVSDKVGGGVFVRRGGTFIMKGGTISNNSAAGAGGGIAYSADDYNNNSPSVILENGTISGNKMDAVVSDLNGKYTASDGQSNDIAVVGSAFSHISRYLTVSNSMSLDDSKIYMANQGFSIDNPANNVKFGNASASCETAATEEYTDDGLTAVVGSMWYQTAEESLPLTVYDLDYYSAKELFAVVMETQEDGTPVSDAKVQLFTVKPGEDGNFHLVLPGGNANGYAVVFLQEDDKNAQIVKVTPADITIYTGGKGYTGAVTGTDSSTDSGLPEPGFFVTLPDELDTELKAAVGYTGDEPIDLSKYLTFEAKTTEGATRSWALERYDADGVSTVTVDGKNMYVYRLVPASGQEPVRMQFTDSEDGHIIVSDAFDVDMETLYQKYDMSIYTNRVDTATIQAKINEKVNTKRHEYLTATAPGELTVRGVVDDIITDIKTDTPSSVAEIAAVTDVDTKYLINGSNLEVNDPSSVKLLVDQVVDEGKEVLKDFVIENVDKITDDFQFEFRYLDLVDTSNGNVWIRPDKPMTIYWPYPEGADSDDTFYVIHFDGLDRNYDSLEDQLTEDVMEECQIKHVSGGISFTTDTFSPFAVVWKESTSSGGSGGTTSYTITSSAGTGGSIAPSGKVSVTSGSDKTFTITAADGYELVDVQVDGKSVGAVGTYTFEKVSANHTISASFREKSAVADPDDTGVSDWLNTKDHKAYMNGYPDGSFVPDRNMTRAEAAQMFFNLLLDQNVESSATFSDVPKDAWYAEAVNTLASLGMINGMGDGLYCPERSVTRAEFTAMAMRFAKLPEGGENIFSDVSESDWFYDMVTGAVPYGWINGYPDGTFRPNNTITRAEVTAIVNRMLGRSADRTYVDEHIATLRNFTDVSKEYWAYYEIMEAANTHDYTKDNSGESWID